MQGMRGGWKQNRTALTTEPKDKEKTGLADRKACLGAWSCYVKGNRKRTAYDNQRLSEEKTPLTALSTIRNSLSGLISFHLVVFLGVCLLTCDLSTGQNDSEDLKSSGPSKPGCAHTFLHMNVCFV